MHAYKKDAPWIKRLSGSFGTYNVTWNSGHGVPFWLLIERNSKGKEYASNEWQEGKEKLGGGPLPNDHVTWGEPG